MIDLGAPAIAALTGIPHRLAGRHRGQVSLHASSGLVTEAKHRARGCRPSPRRSWTCAGSRPSRSTSRPPSGQSPELRARCPGRWADFELLVGGQRDRSRPWRPPEGFVRSAASVGIEFELRDGTATDTSVRPRPGQRRGPQRSILVVLPLADRSAGSAMRTDPDPKGGWGRRGGTARAHRRAEGLTLLEVMAAVAILMGLVYTALAWPGPPPRASSPSEFDSRRRLEASMVADARRSPSSRRWLRWQESAGVPAPAWRTPSGRTGDFAVKQSEVGFYALPPDLFPRSPKGAASLASRRARRARDLGGSDIDASALLEVRVRSSWSDGINEHIARALHLRATTTTRRPGDAAGLRASSSTLGGGPTDAETPPTRAGGVAVMRRGFTLLEVLAVVLLTAPW